MEIPVICNSESSWVRIHMVVGVLRLSRNFRLCEIRQKFPPMRKCLKIKLRPNIWKLQSFVTLRALGYGSTWACAVSKIKMKGEKRRNGVLLLVICNSVKMGIHLCYKWDKPK